MQTSVHVPVDLFTIIKQGLHGQLWELWQMVSLFFYTSAWLGVFIALADTFGFY
ncbi:hypothetical protein [Methylobacter luteus]|uniref:hypothetical protein n=1 Tax=Methylobacter luteus TaxID=415 RepID=UPI0012DF3B9F|nr:hypothetical protein [Methylobacter luteus]